MSDCSPGYTNKLNAKKYEYGSAQGAISEALRLIGTIGPFGLLRLARCATAAATANPVTFNNEQ